MKGLTITQYINFNGTKISVSASIFCIMRRNWPYPPTASGSDSRQAGGKVAGKQISQPAGRQAGRQAGR